MQAIHEGLDVAYGQMQLSGELFGKFSAAALKEFASLSAPSSYPANFVLFSEKEDARGVYIVLEGEVKLSINSSDGRRLSLRIARKGDILGLTSALSGQPYEVTAETVFPAKLVPIGRREFLGFVMRHPEAYQIFSEELTREFTMACEQLRTVGLASSAPEKLARLLLEWSEKGQAFDQGAKFRFSMTHEQIGEFIGASRETVTRTLSTFKSRQLVSFHGSTLTIPNKAALANYAGC
ncbi:MAG TPA: Crp/Fnr family transcriptional regulator [Terracidiphilus sp.]|jgi:CRP/FNR family transcriptional regulator|nr:Crp/Fnr family transcriptional regulator [Terracidiphilus sp.]